MNFMDVLDLNKIRLGIICYHVSVLDDLCSQILAILPVFLSISTMKWIFLYLLTSELAQVSLLAETPSNSSIQLSHHKENVSSTPSISGNEMTAKKLVVIGSLSWNITENQTANYWNFNDQISEDPQYCVSDQEIQCDSSDLYRTINGSCNNLIHPTWGIVNECYLRYQPAFYEGFETLRISKSGDPLPPARDIVLNIFKDVHRPSSKVSFMFTIYGQAIAHDLSHAANKNIIVPCCSPEFSNHSSCIVAPVRSNDPFYSQFNVTCINIHRTESCTICNTTKREQISDVTSALDASMVYGSEDTRALELRAKDGTGKLNISSNEHGEFLPRDTHRNEIFCTHRKIGSCFYSGDVRVNMHTFLIGISTYFLREHNRLATLLKRINPHWEEEKLYQEARRINTATLQCITYKEYLPLLLGPYIMEQFNLTVSNTTEESRYNPNVRLGVYKEFAAAAFRLHSMIPKAVGSDGFRFKDFYQRVEPIHEGHMDKLMQGVFKVPSENSDHYYVNDVTEYMAQHIGDLYGTDLSSFDINRGRDHGLAPYVEMVRFCSGERVNISNFEELAPSLMPKKRAKILKENYAAVEDVDLYVGLQMEDHFPGSEVGPTAACLIAKQFYSAKYGDRFFWEHEGEVPSFTTDQRNSLKQCSLSRLLCDNANITHVQKNVMLLPSITNPEMSCEEIPEIDLSLWKETPQAR